MSERHTGTENGESRMSDDVTQAACNAYTAKLSELRQQPVVTFSAMEAAIAAARSAALEEAAAEMDRREQVAATARDSFWQINSLNDAARHDHYRAAYGSAAAVIRDLIKDK